MKNYLHIRLLLIKIVVSKINELISNQSVIEFDSGHKDCRSNQNGELKFDILMVAKTKYKLEYNTVK